MSRQPETARLEPRVRLLRSLLAARLPRDQIAWLDEQMARVAAASDALSMAVSLASRRLGKEPLRLSKAEKNAALAVRPGIDLGDWGTDQVGRVLLVLAGFAAAPASFPARLDALVRAGEIGEQIALLRGLPLYPMPKEILATAGEGVRSAMQPIFEAVAHNSPYPAEHFPEAMWNQMVVKALFIGSRLAPIVDLDARRNAELARMLVDYAHERWAAGRAVSPELWRCVGPFADEEHYFEDLLKVFGSPVAVQRRAAALALAECPAPDALVALETAPELWRDIRSGRLTWATLN
jgi:hypothetical protein